MAKRDLVIGVFSNYGIEELKPWILSLKESGFSGDAVLIGVDIPEDSHTAGRIREHGVIFISAKSIPGIKIHMMRFLFVYDYLMRHINEYRFVITTDVRDVVFQRNPSVRLEAEASVETVELIAVSEAIRIKDENWNKNNILKNYGEYFYERIEGKPVCNVGIIAGRHDCVRDMCFYIYQMSINRPDWVADQAAYNLILDTYPWKNHSKILGLHSAWACNLHVTNKPDQMEEFGPYLMEHRPTIMDNGLVLNSSGMPFAIVHQYDRVPELNAKIMKKYGANTNTYITFKTEN